MEETVDEIKDEMQELEKESDLQNSRINSINRSLDSLESDMEETKGNISETSNTLDTRLSAIEKMLDLDKRDIAEAVKPDACELEQLSTIPEASRGDEFTVRVQRAIALYENYEQISTPVRSGGKRILSKDIKTFLNGYSNTEIKYTQVQRVIDSFIEKTDDNYYIQKTDEGRAIIWKPEN
jgi:chromosome segregation ATPase